MQDVIQIVDGKYRCDANHLAFKDARGRSLAQKKFLRAQLQRSVDAFERKYESGAKFHSHTFTIPSESLTYYEAQLNFQFFTLENVTQ